MAACELAACELAACEAVAGEVAAAGATASSVASSPELTCAAEVVSAAEALSVAEALSAAEVALAEAALADTALAAEKESGIRSSRTTGTWIVSSSPSSSTGTGWGTAVNKLRRRTAPERGPATLAWGLLAAPAEAAEAGSLAEAAEAL